MGRLCLHQMQSSCLGLNMSLNTPKLYQDSPAVCQADKDFSNDRTSVMFRLLLMASYGQATLSTSSTPFYNVT